MPPRFTTTISGFTIFPITYSTKVIHYLYVRHHSGPKNAASSSSQLPSDRTLFVVNVPPDATDREIILLFKFAGTVEKVVFGHNGREDQRPPEEDDDHSAEDSNGEEGENTRAGETVGETNDDEDLGGNNVDQRRKRRKTTTKDVPAAVVPKVTPLPPSSNVRRLRPTGRSAHIVFLDSSSLTRVTSMASKPHSWPTTKDEPHGRAHYMALHDSLRPPLDVLREHADTCMELFEYEQAKKRQKSKYRKGEAVVDEDGFTLVTRGGAYGKTLGGGVGVASKRFQKTGQTSRNRKDKKEKKEKASFYAFQKAEKQRSELMELKRKWEEDKAQVEKLKVSRRFKPY